MIPLLQNKHIVLGVSGSIACYKALELTSKLTQAGSLVDIVMTNGAKEFVSPLSFRSITHREVVTEMFNFDSELSVNHVALAKRADLMVVAPATANILAKLALGISDNPLTTTYIATNAPVIVAPAMDGHMYHHATVQNNLNSLRNQGVFIIGPSEGYLASGTIGKGRLVETPEIIGHIRNILGKSGDLSGYTILISAGGTQEPLDPARIITNRSSGKMGYAIAEAARDRGAQTILVATPTNQPDPIGVEVIKVKTALEMRHHIQKQSHVSQALIMAAAVSDYRPKLVSSQKIKKGSDSKFIELTPNPDIIKGIKGTMIKIGFAAETENLASNAHAKLIDKDLDLIVANDITNPQSEFGADTNKVIIISKKGTVEDLPVMSKNDVAHTLLDKVRDLIKD